MGVLWMVDGVLYRDPWFPIPEKADAVHDFSQDEPAEQQAARSDYVPESEKDEWVPPLPPPNSEVAAQPRSDLQARATTRGRRQAPLSALQSLQKIENESREQPLTQGSVQDIMSRELLTVPAHTETENALELLKQSGFHHLPVVDVEGRLVGLVSDRDLLGRGGTIAHRMSRRVLTALGETSIQSASQALVKAQFHSLVVIDADTRPRGMVTSFDILNFLVKHPAMKLWAKGVL